MKTALTSEDNITAVTPDCDMISVTPDGNITGHPYVRDTLSTNENS